MRTKLKAASASVLLMLASASAANAGAVIVGKDSSLSAMDLERVRSIFLARENNINGANVVILYQKSEATRSEFENRVLDKTGADLNIYWAKLIFTGKATAPEELGGDSAVRARVAGNPNAIGYVTDAGIDSTVKVLFKY